MSENLEDITYDELIVNSVDLYSYFVQKDYSYNNLILNFNIYTASYIIDQLKLLLNNNTTIDYDLINEILKSFIQNNTTFSAFFNQINIEPYYNFIETSTIVDSIIKININNLQKNVLIKILNQIESPIDEPVIDTETDTETDTINEDGEISSEIVENTNVNYSNNEIVFSKSFSSNSNIFESINKKDTWKLVTIIDDLDIVFTHLANTNMIVQITAGLNINSIDPNTYSWGLYDNITKSIIKSSIIYSNTQPTTTLNLTKTAYFNLYNISNEDINYNLKWIHKDTVGQNQIQIDNSYPITILVWKLVNNNSNLTNLNYLQYLTQKINELETACNTPCCNTTPSETTSCNTATNQQQCTTQTTTPCTTYIPQHQHPHYYQDSNHSHHSYPASNLTSVNSNIDPSIANTYNIGSSSHQWKNIVLSDTATAPIVNTDKIKSTTTLQIDNNTQICGNLIVKGTITTQPPS